MPDVPNQIRQGHSPAPTLAMGPPSAPYRAPPTAPYRSPAPAPALGPPSLAGCFCGAASLGMQPTPKQDTPNQIRKGHSPPKQAVSPQAAYPDCGCRNAGADGGGANRRAVGGGGGSRVAPLPLDETLSLDATPMLHRPAAAWRMAAVLPSPAAVSCPLDENRILNAAESHGLRRSATACLPRVPPSSASLIASLITSLITSPSASLDCRCACSSCCVPPKLARSRTSGC